MVERVRAALLHRAPGSAPRCAEEAKPPLQAGPTSARLDTDTELRSPIIIYLHNEHGLFSRNKNNSIGALVSTSVEKDWLDSCPRTVRVRETHNDKQSRNRRRVTGISHR
jgi:hypothetical protein